MVVTGTVTAIIGLLGLVFHWGSSASRAVAGVSRTIPQPTTTSAVSTVPVVVERPEEFLALFVKALRERDVAFLFDRLHPAVVERYGAQQCHDETRRLVDPTAALQVVGVDPPRTYNWVTDGRARPLPDTYVFHVRGTRFGEPAIRQYHLPLVDGRYRILADCGNPLPAP